MEREEWREAAKDRNLGKIDAYIEGIKENINGILVDIENNEIKLIVNAKYKFIPVEINLMFDCRSEDGDAVLHYKKGNIGFISISKEKIFQGIKENKWIKIDKENGDIIVTLDTIDGLEITDVKAEKDNIELSIHGDISLFKWDNCSCRKERVEW